MLLVFLAVQQIHSHPIYHAKIQPPMHLFDTVQAIKEYKI